MASRHKCEVWTKHTLCRCHFGLRVIVIEFLTIFKIFTNQTINRLMEKIINRLIHNKNQAKQHLALMLPVETLSLLDNRSNVGQRWSINCNCDAMIDGHLLQVATSV